MQTYSQFRPTQFDSRGLGLPDRQDWLVVPVSQHRDSDILSQSNFSSALYRLGEESDTVEVHRFGHWAHGWLEIILAHPQHYDTVHRIEEYQEAYTVLDYPDYLERLYEYAQEWWDNASTKMRVEVCQKFGVSIFAARHSDLPGEVDVEEFEYA